MSSSNKRYGMLIPIGILLIFLGIITVMAGSILTGNGLSGTGKKSSDSGVKFAVGGFLGPIPFGFGNDKVLLYVAVGVSAFFMIMYLVFHFTAAGG